jgi:hypothetical protein
MPAAEAEYGSAWPSRRRASRGGAVLLVVGVEDEQHVDRPASAGLGSYSGSAIFHIIVEEVLAEVERRCRVDERHADEWR